MRKRLFEIIESDSTNDSASSAYDLFMVITIVVSLIPLMFYEPNHYLLVLDSITALIFVIDYLLRWITADYKLDNGLMSFAVYPFTPLAVLDFVTILTSFTTLAPGFKVLKIFRLLKSLRAVRALKALRYSDNIDMIFSVIKKQQKSLMAVCYMAFAYIFMCALVMFSIEPDTFHYKFFNAIYWATISLSTTGYGDIFPLTSAGRIFTMLSTLVGIAVVALPSSIITAGFMDELEKKHRAERKEEAFLRKLERAEKKARRQNELEKEVNAVLNDAQASLQNVHTSVSDTIDSKNT